MRSREVGDFAESIRSIVVDHPTPGGWFPGALGDDVVPGLRDRLRGAGWYELPDEPEGAAFIGAAAVELGRGLVALGELDALLGGSPCLAGLARYARSGQDAVLPGADGPRPARIVAAEPVPYGDSIAACRVRVESGEPLDADRSRRREAAWMAATVGYLAGLTAEALRITLEYARSRRAFGTTLAGLDGVQRRLADAALDADGLLLLAQAQEGLGAAPDHRAALDAGMEALAHAGPASCAVLAQCHQVVGAIGYTLEFPLQRFSRRARTIHLWADAWIEARTGSAVRPGQVA